MLQFCNADAGRKQEHLVFQFLSVCGATKFRAWQWERFCLILAHLLFWLFRKPSYVQDKVNELSVGRYLVSIVSTDLQNTKVTLTLCSENTRYSGDRRNAKSLPVFLGRGGGAFLCKVEYRKVEIRQNVSSYAFGTIPDVARYIDLQHRDQPTNIAVASWGKRYVEACYGVVIVQ
jgi:hypothetical protein